MNLLVQGIIERVCGKHVGVLQLTSKKYNFRVIKHTPAVNPAVMGPFIVTVVCDECQS